MILMHAALLVTLAAVAMPQVSVQTQTGQKTKAPSETPAPNPALVRVFVHTDDLGDSRELAERRESVRDLTKAVANKKKTLAAMDVKAGSDVVLEVLERTVFVPKVVIGLSPRPGDPTNMPGMGMNGPVRQVILRVKLTAGGDPLILTNKNKPAESTQGWKSAADDIGGQVEKWIAERKGEILNKRR